jgi:hypothetical protein
MTTLALHRRLFGLLAVGLFVVVSGCGDATVSGRVLFDGRPLPGGRLTFLPADSSRGSIPSEISDQGNYQAVLPRGKIRVTVDNRELQGQGSQEGGSVNTKLPKDLPLSPEVKKLIAGVKDQKAPDDAPKPPSSRPTKLTGTYIQIPEKYYFSDKAGLEFTVEGGTQEHDILLTQK